MSCNSVQHCVALYNILQHPTTLCSPAGSVTLSTVQHCTAPYSPTQHYIAPHSTAQCYTAVYGASQHHIAPQSSAVECCTAPQSNTPQGAALQSTAQLSQCHTALYGLTQQHTALYSTVKVQLNSHRASWEGPGQLQPRSQSLLAGISQHRVIAMRRSGGGQAALE